VAIGAVCFVAAGLYRLGTPHNFFDLRIYMRAMRWWSAGNPLYDYVQPDRVQGELYFTYPPFTALLLRPFASLPLGATIMIFTTLTVLAVVVTVQWLIARTSLSAADDRNSRPLWFLVGLAVPATLVVESVRETINFGQIGMLLVALILADLLFAVPRGSRWAGVGVGLATAIKLYPGIFVIYLLASRRWRAGLTAGATALAATLFAAALAPADSWRFWTHELWATGRVGRTDYTGNQSLYGLLSRLSVPDKPNQVLWLVLVATVAGYGLWRAARAGNELAGITLTGLVGALVSPITWTHHIYWLIPTVVVLLDAGLQLRREPTQRRRGMWLLILAGVVYVSAVYGVVSYYDWGFAPVPTDAPHEFVLRNLYVLLALLLLVVLPTRRFEPAQASSGRSIRQRPMSAAGG
jgi:alpha-1,2-mannosyltransferase